MDLQEKVEESGIEEELKGRKWGEAGSKYIIYMYK